MKKFSLDNKARLYHSNKATTQLLVNNPYTIFETPKNLKTSLYNILKRYTNITKQQFDKRCIILDQRGTEVRIKMKSIKPTKVLTSTSYGYIIALLFLTGKLPIKHLQAFLQEVTNMPPSTNFGLKQFLSLSLKREAKLALLDALEIDEYTYLRLYKQMIDIKLSTKYNQEVADWVDNVAVYSEHHDASIIELYNYQYATRSINQWHHIEVRQNILTVDELVAKWLRDNIALYHSIGNYVDLDNLLKIYIPTHMVYSHNNIISTEAYADLSDIDNIYAEVGNNTTLQQSILDIDEVKKLSVRDLDDILVDIKEEPQDD